MRRRTGIAGGLLLSLFALGVGMVAFGIPLLRIASGSVSRSLCAATFVSGLDPDRVYAEENLPANGMRWLDWALRYDVDREHREVRASVAGLWRTRAVDREGMGCLLVSGDGVVPEPRGLPRTGVARPVARSSIVESAEPAIVAALESAFAEPDAAHLRRTKAIVVMHSGTLIAERYAAGIGPDTPLWGHSLTKSLTNALIGILVRQGRLRIDQPVPLAAWRTAADPRRAITVDQLLRMSSGLPFDETGVPLNPANRMWFLSADMTGYASRVPLVHAPGTAWGYSNLGYVILSRLVRDAGGGSGGIATARFMRRELFDPLGMRTAIVESDATGTPVGSGSGYASARDWTRLGQLYLDDGVVAGRRVLPNGWASYSASQTLQTGYGAGFWTNRINQGRVPVWDAPWGMPQLPPDMFYARGALGQYIVIVPSEHLVVARFGVSHDGSTGIGDTVARIIAALRAQDGASRTRGDRPTFDHAN